MSKITSDSWLVRYISLCRCVRALRDDFSVLNAGEQKSIELGIDLGFAFLINEALRDIANHEAVANSRSRTK